MGISGSVLLTDGLVMVEFVLMVAILNLMEGSSDSVEETEMTMLATYKMNMVSLRRNLRADDG